jgi:hypothetical protein
VNALRGTIIASRKAGVKKMTGGQNRVALNKNKKAKNRGLSAWVFWYALKRKC